MTHCCSVYRLALPAILGYVVRNSCMGRINQLWVQQYSRVGGLGIENKIKMLTYRYLYSLNPMISKIQIAIYYYTYFPCPKKRNLRKCNLTLCNPGFLILVINRGFFITPSINVEPHIE